MKTRDLILSICLATGLSASAWAFQTPPAPAGKSTTAAAKLEQPKVEERVRCDRDLRGVGSIIGTRTCQTKSQREEARKAEAEAEAAQRAGAQEFLRSTLTIPAFEESGGIGGVPGF